MNGGGTVARNRRGRITPRGDAGLINTLKAKDIAIIGYAETKIVRRSGRSTYDLAAEATSKLLEYTGVGLADIDGLA